LIVLNVCSECGFCESIVRHNVSLKGGWLMVNAQHYTHRKRWSFIITLLSLLLNNNDFFVLLFERLLRPPDDNWEVFHFTSELIYFSAIQTLISEMVQLCPIKSTSVLGS